MWYILIPFSEFFFHFLCMLILYQAILQFYFWIGTLPTVIGELSSLTYMNIGSNSFSGSFPSEIGLLTQLLYLRVYTNKFEGKQFICCLLYFKCCIFLFRCLRRSDLLSFLIWFANLYLFLHLTIIKINRHSTQYYRTTYVIALSGY